MSGRPPSTGRTRPGFRPRTLPLQDPFEVSDRSVYRRRCPWAPHAPPPAPRTFFCNLSESGLGGGCHCPSLARSLELRTRSSSAEGHTGRTLPDAAWTLCRPPSRGCPRPALASLRSALGNLVVLLLRELDGPALIGRDTCPRRAQGQAGAGPQVRQVPPQGSRPSGHGLGFVCAPLVFETTCPIAHRLSPEPRYWEVLPRLRTPSCTNVCG